MGENLDDLGHGDAFLDTTLNTGSMKERKLDFIKIIFKKICPVEDNSKSTRRQATDWGKILKKITHLIKDLNLKYIRNL